MWATVSSLLGLSLLYLILFALPFPVFLSIFVFYISYASGPRPNFRKTFPGFTWLREQHCKLSYTGNDAILFDKNKARLFIFHPHGVHCVGATLLGSDPKTTHVRIACTYLLFWIPIVREFAYWSNSFSCTRENIVESIKNGYSVVLYPGGMNEIPGAYFLRNDQKQTPYTKRKGFIDVAMTLGCEIVPCWIDGEEALYDVFHPFPKLQKLCYKLFRYPWPLISWGWKYVPFLPKSKPVTIRVGNPIQCVLSGNRDEYFQQYEAEVHRLANLEIVNKTT